MSCIAGLFHLGGSPIDRGQLEAMLVPMKLRAPDGERLHCAGAIGLAQSFLRTGTSKAESFNQLTLDGKVYIAADARIDGRAELLRKLRCAGRQAASDAPHAELILHAYAAFGDVFLEHLLGDFAFALWDGEKQKLICARDHFGIRPFYFFQTHDLFGFASDMDALRRHPAVSDALDKHAVVDFLLFSSCAEAHQTLLQDIRCLPPATRYDLSLDGRKQTRYWQVPGTTETRYSSPAAYVERFVELFDQAVSDRLPGGTLALQLSGGMDSTAIAATTVLRCRHSHPVTAFHYTGRSLLPEDDEFTWAQMVADHLGIPMETLDVGEYPLFQDSTATGLSTPFPMPSGNLPGLMDATNRMVDTGARVLFSGYGADAMLTPSHTYYLGLLRGGALLKFMGEVAHHIRHARSLSGMALRSSLSGARGAPSWRPDMPGWISPEFADETQAASRWEAWWKKYQAAIEPQQQLGLPWMARQFEAGEILRQPLTVRYPFFDRRLVEFLLGIPNFMRAGKKIMREGMGSILPGPITARPKKSVPGDMTHVAVTFGNIDARMLLGNASAQYGVSERAYMDAWRAYAERDSSKSTWSGALILLPLALADWYRNRSFADE